MSQGPAPPPSPGARQAGRRWSLLGLYKACKLTLWRARGGSMLGARDMRGRGGEGGRWSGS